jgi:hypothetical protein
MKSPLIAAGAIAWSAWLQTSAQTPPAPPQLVPATHTAYSARTELFAEWPPLVVGQATRLTAHLTRTGARFTPYTEAKVALTLAVEGSTASASADGPERPGVFRLNVTPTRAGAGRMTIDVTAAGATEHFVIEGVPIYPDVQTATARQAARDPGLVSYAKERSWEEDFATALVSGRFQGAARMLLIPMAAVVRDGTAAHVYVQRTPERFEWREIITRRTVGEMVEVTAGLRDGERIVVRGADKMPRK